MNLLSQFFQKHAACELTLVIGNHDLHLFKSEQNPLPPTWNMKVVPQLAIGRVGLTHDPAEWPCKSKPGKSKPDSKASGTGREPIALVLCGHLHPAIRASSLTDSAGKLPCFWFSRQRLVLPAIGTFTGTYRVDPGSGDQTWVIADQQVIAFGKNVATANAFKVPG
jgi:metallophosphoesterase superfamily enzyme